MVGKTCTFFLEDKDCEPPHLVPSPLPCLLRLSEREVSASSRTALRGICGIRHQMPTTCLAEVMGCNGSYGISTIKDNLVLCLHLNRNTTPSQRPWKKYPKSTVLWCVPFPVKEHRTLRRARILCLR